MTPHTHGGTDAPECVTCNPYPLSDEARDFIETAKILAEPYDERIAALTAKLTAVSEIIELAIADIDDHNATGAYNRLHHAVAYIRRPVDIRTALAETLAATGTRPDLAAGQWDVTAAFGPRNPARTRRGQT